MPSYKCEPVQNIQTYQEVNWIYLAQVRNCGLFFRKQKLTFGHNTTRKITDQLSYL